MLLNVFKGLPPLSVTNMDTIVDVLYKECESFDTFFKDKNEISYQIAIDNHLRKGLLLAAASYFEVLITDCLINFFDETSNSNSLVTSFLKNKALKRQYHTLFKWDDKKGYTSFFGFMGEKFKDYMSANMKINKHLADGLSAFMSLGAERNLLVHLNYGTYTVQKTIPEIYKLYNDALYFVNGLPDFLRLKEIAVDSENPLPQ